ncbi:hypothetical protein FLGE108171_00480 [Flavobacterium gelidilacus]|jgi:hypothetical protein|uniref:hypothetical protein n=1 Tax=Flavobacterium gelidilacus TaxID=206041 RepID=UPI000421DDF8|nr:hypothetical protein [Flavobacterium gelidilacus]
MMKKVVTILILCLTFLTNAQEKITLPAIVEANFEKEFKDIKDVNWSIFYRGKNNNDLRFEAEFLKGNSRFLISYSDDGVIKAIQKSIALSSLKEKVKKYLIDKYPTYQINEASLIVKQDQKTYYDVGVSDETNYFILVFDGEGNYLYLTPLSDRL